MSAPLDWKDLLKPITDAAPCGDDLEDTALLASIEGARLFGRARPFDAEEDPKDPTSNKRKPPEWNEFIDTTRNALGRSRDLRLLANLAVALLRTEGIGAFVDTLPVASYWLEQYWTDLYPRLDEGDAMRRRSALNCFADSMAVLDGLRRLPIVSSRQHGTLTLREIDLATGQLSPRDGEPRPDSAQVNAAFSALPGEELVAFAQRVGQALAAVKQIEVAMGTAAGPDGVPDLEALSAPLTRIERALTAQVALRTGSPEAAGIAVAEAGGAAGRVMAVGAIGSRQDAIRALDAVAEYFRQNEPSSPIPLFVERAKRLVSKNFLEVLADVVPDALPHVRAVGGVPESE
jgi:type VI secretion system protein ImpA